VYIAVAEAVDAPLATCDLPLDATPGHSARIEVVVDEAAWFELLVPCE
jgi:hypothetical protein